MMFSFRYSIESMKYCNKDQPDNNSMNNLVQAAFLYFHLCSFSSFSLCLCLCVFPSAHMFLSPSFLRELTRLTSSFKSFALKPESFVWFRPSPDPGSHPAIQIISSIPLNLPIPALQQLFNSANFSPFVLPHFSSFSPSRITFEQWKEAERNREIQGFL